MPGRHIIVPLLICILLCNCQNEMHFFKPKPAFTYDTTLVTKLCAEMASRTTWCMYADNYARQLLTQQENQPTWVSPKGVSDQAHVLIDKLDMVSEMGFRPESFHMPELQLLCDSIDSLKVDDQTIEGVDTLFAKTEWLLTNSLLRLAYGLRYGFVRPAALFNRLLQDEGAPEGTFRKTFDIPIDKPTDSLGRAALQAVRDEELGRFLDKQQPDGRLYQAMQAEYTRAQKNNETQRARLARINMERARWRYDRPEEGLTVFVNLAGATLTARDTERDTTLQMKVCIGNQSHKTPMLCSKMKHLELNPYWTIPASIIRKEIVASHLGDSAYFRRNNIHAIDKETKEQVSAVALSKKQLLSGRYTLRQEKGDGNSLGRMIFRFKNNFQVYLHDTNNRRAFQRENRTLSHGCVRLERPLDLALFLMGEKVQDSLYADRIRMSIDMEPVSARGKKWREKNPEGKTWTWLQFPQEAQLWIDYYTLWPDGTDGQLQAHPDTYGYDKEIERLLDKL